MIQSLFIAVRSPAVWLAGSVALLCTVLQFTDFVPALSFNRESIANGDWYLLLTGNFVHLGLSHLGMNMAGFALIVALVWQHFKAWEWLIVILFASLVVGTGLYLRDPQVIGYVGFSGTLHGLIIAGCLADLKHYPKSAALLLVLVTGKLVWEQISGALPGSEDLAGGAVVVNSHLYGAIGGAVIGAVLLGIRMMRRSSVTAPSN